MQLAYVFHKKVRQLQARNTELGPQNITENLVKIISNEFHILYWKVNKSPK
jgi:hypothetical protein